MWAGVALLVVSGYGVQGQSAVQGEKEARTAAPVLFEDENWKAVCATALAAPLPPAAAAFWRRRRAGRTRVRPRSAMIRRCTTGSARLPTMARRCGALIRGGLIRTTRSWRGRGTLAMLYANGDGVSRSYPLAIRFACELDHVAETESEYRIGRLEALRDGRLPAGTSFDLCDDQVSGAMGGFCSELKRAQGRRGPGAADRGDARAVAGAGAGDAAEA